MEKLSRRSDSAVETPSGLLAVTPRVRSGVTGETAWFEFKAHMLSEVTRIEWPAGAPVIVVDSDTARALVVAGYAGEVSDELIESYNAAVDSFQAGKGGIPAASTSTLPPTHTPPKVQFEGSAPRTPDLSSAPPASPPPSPSTTVQPVQPAAIPDLVQIQAPEPSPPPAQTPALIDLLNGPPPTPTA